MLPRYLRLKRRQDFGAVRRRGARWHDPLLTLAALPNGLPYSRFGFTVGRRIGTAVTRNALKRRLRAVVRRWLPELKPGRDVVITAHRLASDATYQTLEATLGALFRQAGLTIG